MAEARVIPQKNLVLLALDRWGCAKDSGTRAPTTGVKNWPPQGVHDLEREQAW